MSLPFTANKALSIGEEWEGAMLLPTLLLSVYFNL
jgi:hypothetical protein